MQAEHKGQLGLRHAGVDHAGPALIGQPVQIPAYLRLRVQLDAFGYLAVKGPGLGSERVDQIAHQRRMAPHEFGIVQQGPGEIIDFTGFQRHQRRGMRRGNMQQHDFAEEAPRLDIEHDALLARFGKIQEPYPALLQKREGGGFGIVFPLVGLAYHLTLA